MNTDSRADDPSELKLVSEINVTPLVDVMLVLLIIFMVTAPMLSVGMKVTLPKSAASAPLDAPRPLIVVVNKDHTVSVGDKITRREDIVATIKAELKGDTTRAVQLRGDTLAAYGDVVYIFGELSKMGIRKIAVETSPSQPPP